MNDKYKTYDDVDFFYNFPYTWKSRNKKYLEKRDEQRITKLKPKPSQSIRKVIVDD